MIPEHTPFWHALDLAWCGDGALSLHSIRLLDAMQHMLQISDADRALIESKFEDEVVFDLNRAGFGCGDQALAGWVGALTFLDDPAAADVSRALGRAALMAGLSRERWNAGISWMDQLTLGVPFKEGVWREGDESGELARLPAILLPVARELGVIADEE